MGVPAVGWGPDGHRIVGEIAWARLDPEARRMVRRWMPDETYGSLARTSDWADTAARRQSELEWALPLHYVNVSPDAKRYRGRRDCPGGDCVVAAIGRFQGELAAARAGDRTADPVQALRFLSHFVGDLHQPLHVSHPDGRGGNRTFVLFYGEVVDLHRIWDSGWLEQAIAALPRGRRDWEGYVGYLLERRASSTLGQETLSPKAWADESLALAREWAFDPPESVGPTDLPGIRAVIDRQLLKAGNRLAALLNEIAELPGGVHEPGPADVVEPATPSRIGPKAAAEFIGLNAVVCGKVTETSYRADVRGKPTFLNFGGRHPRQAFTALIWGKHRDRFDAPEKHYLNREVCVRGKVRSHRGKPQIVVSRPEQLDRVAAKKP